MSFYLHFFTLQYFGVTSVGFRIGFQTIRKGTRDGKDSGYYVIQNAEQWNEICKRVFPPDAVPEINFSNTTVIAVFMGLRPTAGYAIEVKEITDTIFRVVVKVAWTTPDGKMLPNTYIAISYNQNPKNKQTNNFSNNLGNT